ncbi:GMC family oxidoreductase, partial [Pseudomonas laurentiana]|nr:GMC family oxidoreductase [Pseudomonas laurentiana]
EAFTSAYQSGKGNITTTVLSEVRTYGMTARVKGFFENLMCEIGAAHKIDYIAKFNCPGDGVISTLIEQFPSVNSRISLLNERDELGVAKVSIHWELSPADRHTIKSIGLEMAKRFAETGLGFVKLNDYVYDTSVPLNMTPHAHHMGTTRMAATPEQGVVDTNCRVFGTDNLYIAGSSIFSTGGACNPTMPLLQFALRLADHLNEKMRSLASSYS